MANDSVNHVKDTKDTYGGAPESEILRFLSARTYDYACKYTKDADVLDLGCGPGYGSSIMSQNAKSVIGVDIFTKIIKEAKENYGSEKVSFQPISDVHTTPLPFPDKSFDVVVSLQVIEHLKSPKPYLTEIKRILKDDGILLTATPNRIGRLMRFQKPWNRFHTREYDAAGFKSCLLEYFPKVEILALTGDEEILYEEVKRTKKLSRITLPTTLACIPEPLRIFGLTIMSAIRSAFAGKKSIAGTYGKELSSKNVYFDRKYPEWSPILLAECYKK